MKKLLIVCSIVLLMQSCRNNDKVVMYLIPENYEGPLLLIEDSESKDQLNVVGDTTIFDFSKSNILRINGKFVEGSNALSNIKYFYIDEIGKRREIPITLKSYDKENGNDVFVYLKYTQIRDGSQCDLITTPENFALNLEKQEKLCDSLLAIRPKE